MCVCAFVRAPAAARGARTHTPGEEVAAAAAAGSVTPSASSSPSASASAGASASASARRARRAALRGAGRRMTQRGARAARAGRGAVPGLCRAQIDGETAGHAPPLCISSPGGVRAQALIKRALVAAGWLERYPTSYIRACTPG